MDPLRIGKSWFFSTDSRPTLRNVWNRTVATDKANDPVAVAPSRLGRGDEKSALETLQAHFRAASSAFRDALRGLAGRNDPVYGPAAWAQPSLPATVSGQAAHVATVTGSASRLHTTVAINTQTTAARTSSAALGLDLSPADTSQLETTSGLALDVTSPETASTLRSSAALGLDRSSSDAASTLRSSTALGLDVTSAEHGSTIASSGAIGAVTTAYDTPTLAFTGSGAPSTSAGTLSGTYTGVGSAAAATALQIIVTQGATGLDPQQSAAVAFEVRDQNGTLLFDYNGSLQADESVYLGDDIGLSLSFSAGDLQTGDSASTGVSHGVAVVDTTAAFDDPDPSARPQFLNGAQVTAGSFTLNGTTIAVDAHDSIDSVLARINAAGLGVTASFADNAVTLTTDAPSESDIVLADDTSGFLDAVRLSTASTTHGVVHDDQQALGGTATFGGVTAGSFTINGTAITIDPTTDSLQAILGRIDAADAGVTAAYDTATDRIVLTGTSAGQGLIRVEDDTTGFLSAAALSTSNTTRGHVAEDGVTLENVQAFQSVTNGSFVVDGHTIAIDVSTDTTQSVIARINGSGARVVAGYDADTDTITLDATYDSEDDVPIGEDTSGFLAAAHLDAANSVRGNLRDDRLALSRTTPFGGVSAGTFEVNGQSVALDPTQDSLATILQRITDAGAGVTATFDDATGRITLRRTSASEDPIILDQDTTGFLDAAGLTSAESTPGNLPDDQQVLARLTQFAGVTDGSFAINGTTIAVDVAQDTLASLVSRINGAGAGVSAAYDAGTDRLTLSPTSPGAALVLGDDTSGFLDAAHLATGAFGLHVDPSAAFNATGLSAPFFDPGVQVGAGSFTVNGTQIDVAADDSIDAVLAKITASAAGVDATYDAATQTVALTTRDDDPAPIIVADDTSGFLAAVKLDGTASSTTGDDTLPGLDAALDRLSEYGAVGAGTVTLNGNALAIDPATTTVRGLVTALDDLEDVAASVNDAGVITIAASRPGDTLTLSDTSGLLSALGITSGVHEGKLVKPQITESQIGTSFASNASAVTERVTEAVDRLNDGLERLAAQRDTTPELTSAVRGRLTAVIDALGSAGVKGVTAGPSDATPAFQVDREALATALHALLGEQTAVATATGSALDDIAARLATLAAPLPSASLTREAARSEIQKEVTQHLPTDAGATNALLVKLLLPPSSPSERPVSRALGAYAQAQDTVGDEDRPPVGLAPARDPSPRPERFPTVDVNPPTRIGFGDQNPYAAAAALSKRRFA